MTATAVRIDRDALARTQRFPGCAELYPLRGVVRDRLLRVVPVSFQTCGFYDRRERDPGGCTERGVRFCPQCLHRLCRAHSRGGVTACCGCHAWEMTADPREDDGFGVIDARTRVLQSAGGRCARL